MRFRKRLTAGLAAAVCCSSMLTVMPSLGPVSAVEAVRNDFEVTYEGWYANADLAELTAIEGIGVDGSRGMAITGRQTPQDGVSSSKGFYLWDDQTYDYSVQVRSESAETFRLTILCIDQETGKETVTEIASVNAKAGEWTKLSGKYRAPKGSYEFKLTITTDSTADFVFDDVVVTGKGEGCLVSAASGNGLKDVFEGYGFRVGNIFNRGTIQNSAIQAIILKDCNAIECENETKADAVLQRNGSTNTDVKVSLNSAAAIIDFCVKNNIAFRGHACVWHSQTPAWFLKENFDGNANWVSKSTMDTRLESYIKNTFNAYKTQYPTLNLYAYDVVNEAINDGTGGPREPGDNNQQGGKSAYVAVYGDNSFIEKAFTYARQYAPSETKLFYNDYNEFAGTKKNGIINSILKPLAAKGVLDGMGMQSHISAAASNAWGDTPSYLAAMDEYLSLGIDVQVTELDISIDNGQSFQDQANKYKAIVQHIVEANTSGKYKGMVTLFQVWGPNDSNTWISGDKKPTLYDGSNQPKLAYTTLKQYGESLPVGPIKGFGDGEYIPPEPPKVGEDGTWFHDTFEDGSCNWEGRGGATVAQTSDGYKGTKGMECSGRTSSWNGISKSLNSLVFEGGQPYAFGVIAKHTGSDNDTLHFTVQYTGTDGETHYDKIATIEDVAPDTWVLLANSSYTLPAGSNHVIYVETGDGGLATQNIYIDEAIGAPEGYQFEGPAYVAPAPFQRGDVDRDGAITAADLSAAKLGMKKGFTDATAKRAADVDQNGKVDADDIKQIHEFLLLKRKEFDKAAVSVDLSLASAFSNVKAGSTLKGTKNANVLTTQRFGADPGWMVYKDRLYIYTTNDAFEYKNGQMQENSYDVRTINCISSEDLVNWTDHGAIPVAGNGANGNYASKWASRSWAPDACWKTIDGKDKFFLYFANNGSGVGVLTSDSPTGPWTDPIGTELVSGRTPNCNDVVWQFDPGVYYDPDTDTGVLAYGGGVPSGKQADPGTARIMKLNKNMTSIDGTPTRLNPPYLFEDSSLIKVEGKWVYSFCHNWNVPGGQAFSNADIGYMTSTDPLGPYTYQGVVFKNTGSQGLDKGGNNHHSIIYFKNQYYVAYHTRQIEIEQGISLNYRSTALAVCNYSGGRFECKGTKNAVPQVGDFNPYAANQAETMYDMSGIQVSGLGDTVVTDIHAGDWIQIKNANFKNGCSSITVKAKSSKGAVIKISTDKPNGEGIGYVNIPAGTNAMTELTGGVMNIDGKSDIYFTFSGECEFDSWQFS